MTNETLLHPTTAPAANDRELPSRWLAAFLQWDALRNQLPDAPATYRAAIDDLKAAGQELPADRVMAEAVRRFPDNLDFAVQHATAAQARKDWQEAVNRWQWVANRFPNQPAGYLNAGIILRRELARPLVAEQVLEVAAARFPNLLDVWTQYAGAAVDRKDRPAALQRYKTMRERFPSFIGGHRWTATLLRELGRFDEAEEVLTEALDRFPDEETLLIDRAWVAQGRQDPEEAVRRWEYLRGMYPNNRGSYWMAALVLMNDLSRYDEADALLSEGMAQFPEHLEMSMDHARVAELAGNWPEAVERWDALARRHPTDTNLPLRLAHARNQSQLAMIDAAGESEAAEPSDRVADTSRGPAARPETISEHRDFFLQFESLGMDCEFGAVQRRFGAEPLGLLRWVQVAPNDLVRMLEARFSGVGEPDQTYVAVDKNTPELRVYDRVYNTHMHTFKRPGDLVGGEEAFLKQMCRRLKYLKRKLIEDLTVSEKIFVYKHPNPLPAEEMLALSEALRGFGPNTLLLVHQAGAQHQAGTVTRIDQGLLVGYVQSFGQIVDNYGLDDRGAANWLELAQAAHAMWKPVAASAA